MTPKPIGLSSGLISSPWKYHAHFKHIDWKLWNACHILRCYKMQSTRINGSLGSKLLLGPIFILVCWLFYQKNCILVSYSHLPIFSESHCNSYHSFGCSPPKNLIPIKVWLNVKIFSYYWKSKTIKSHVQRHNQQPEWSPYHSLVFLKVAQLFY